jgi:hypothetical protein
MSTTLVDNAASTRQVHNAQRVARERDQTDVADLVWILSEPQGRRFLHRLVMGVCDVEGVSHAGGLPAMDMHHHEGRRFVGVQLLAKIREVDAEKWLEAQREAVTLAKREINPEGGRTHE